MPRLVHDVDAEFLKRMKNTIPWGFRQSVVVRLVTTAMDVIESSDNPKLAAAQIANGLFTIKLKGIEE